jgi:hypothetical protein
MMRGAIAAACAAVIMGLASPAAFACASVAAARGAAELQHPALTMRAASRAVVTHVTPRDEVRPAGREATSAPPAGERVVAWRAPSAPAPSRAPPATRS